MSRFLKLPADLVGLIPPTALLVYTIMADACNLKHRCCFMSQKTLAQKCCTSERTIRKIIKTMEYLKMIKYNGYNQIGTVQYVVNPIQGDLLISLQWKLSGGRWETVADVADNEISGHKQATSETVADVDRK